MYSVVLQDAAYLQPQGLPVPRLVAADDHCILQGCRGATKLHEGACPSDAHLVVPATLDQVRLWVDCAVESSTYLMA